MIALGIIAPGDVKIVLMYEKFDRRRPLFEDLTRQQMKIISFCKKTCVFISNIILNLNIISFFFHIKERKVSMCAKM